jgi:hypothetical protein
LAKIAENCDHNIDPRLGEFSPIGRLFSLGSFLKLTEGDPWLLYSTDKTAYLFILTKTVWSTIWAIFSQPHLAPLTLD